MELKTVKISDLKEYGNNPRKNDSAVEAVAESIRQVGYITPIVADEDMVILAGHTRVKALREKGIEEAPVVIAGGLTDEQKRKYRLLDNKAGELASWDFEKLEQELEGLDFEGFDFGFEDEWEYADIQASEKQGGKEDRELVCPHCGQTFSI